MKYKHLLFGVYFLLKTTVLFAQKTTTTLLFESLRGNTPMQWAVQRFELEKRVVPAASISVGLETQSAVLGSYGGD